MHNLLVLCAAAAATTVAQAHQGHGQALPHLHGHEGAGWLLAAAIGLGAWWWLRRGGDR